MSEYKRITREIAEDIMLRRLPKFCAECNFDKLHEHECCEIRESPRALEECKYVKKEIERIMNQKPVGALQQP